MSSINIAAVEYINTLPFLYGLSSRFDTEALNIFKASPANCAELYRSKKVDIALIPVGALASLNNYKIITDFCIGSRGAVDTVALLSQQPLKEIRSIAIDKDSRTSANLIQVLCKYHWDISVNFTPLNSNTPNPDNCLLIGDKVKLFESKFKYKYDLGDAWQQLTGLPMVYAVWIARNNIDPDLINEINSAFDFAINNLNSIPLNGTKNDSYWRNYLAHSIHYTFTAEEQNGMKLFLEKCKHLDL